MPKIATIKLRSPNPTEQKRFYIDRLGMRQRQDGTIGYADSEAGLLFESSLTSYQPSTQHLYWKISIAVPNIELACQQLADRGVDVEGPRQFGDVAFLAHIRDPENFQIELLEHHFKGHRPTQNYDNSLLGGGACLNLLTLRSHDIAQIKTVAADISMTPLAVVPVTESGFTLYFFAYEDAGPPNPDLHAIENRTWVYQRPYTVLEVVHREQSEKLKVHEAEEAEEAGYGGAVIENLGRCFNSKHLLLQGS